MPGLLWATNFTFQSPTIPAPPESLSEASTNDAGRMDAVGLCPGKYPHPVLEDWAQSPWARPRQTVPSPSQNRMLNLLFTSIPPLSEFLAEFGQLLSLGRGD